MENGNWTDIDSNLDTKDNMTYGNKANKLKVRFAKNGQASALTSFEIDGNKVTYSLAEVPSLGSNYYTGTNDVVPVIDQNKITYNNIFQGVDIKQMVFGSQVKEDIILKEYQNKNAFAFKIKMDGVKAVKENDGSITFYKNDSSNEKVFSIPRPTMEDSNIDPGLYKWIAW